MAPLSGLDRKHLPLRVVQRLTRYAFTPRKMLEGQYTGRHASPQRGQSVEFRDYRPYAPGDEVAHVDWKVYGRSDKLYVRRFEHETELRVTLLVDGSESMAYRGDARDHISKYDHACCLAAAIGFLVIHGHDRAGFAFARDGLRHHFAPHSHWASLREVLDTMHAIVPAGPARLAAALTALSPKVRRGDVLVICSDFWEELDELFQAMARVLHVGAEVILFHVLHGDEIELPDWQPLVLVESETKETLSVDPAEIRATYRTALQDYFADLRGRCQRADVTYQLAPLTEPFAKTLERFLSRRSAS